MRLYSALNAIGLGLGRLANFINGELLVGQLMCPGA